VLCRVEHPAEIHISAGGAVDVLNKSFHLAVEGWGQCHVIE
jgi:hypothetical protein